MCEICKSYHDKYKSEEEIKNLKTLDKVYNESLPAGEYVVYVYIFKSFTKFIHFEIGKNKEISSLAKDFIAEIAKKMDYEASDKINIITNIISTEIPLEFQKLIILDFKFIGKGKN